MNHGSCQPTLLVMGIKRISTIALERFTEVNDSKVTPPVCSVFKNVNLSKQYESFSSFPEREWTILRQRTIHD